jgi:molybdopterin synthase sulfur carrier subunit
MTTARPVLVRYFAAASEAAGTEEQTLEIPSDLTLAWLRGYLIKTYGPAMAAAIRDGSFLVDGIAVTDDEARIGEKVDVLPPFAGG